MAADRPSVSLLRSNTPEWKLWSLVAQLADSVDPNSWVLIGGQMVALHLHVAAEIPRFRGPAGQLDLMVADHLPDRLTRQFTKPAPVPVPGGQRALDRRVIVDIHTEFGAASIPVPDLVGALVVKARAATGDTRDRGRHHTDLAQLASIIDDPLTTLDQLDTKAKRSLRKVQLPEDPTMPPWLELSERTRQRAIDAWFTLTDS